LFKKTTSLPWFFSVDPDDLNAESLTGTMNVAGSVIVGIVAILVLVAIALICYAQKYNVRKT
jgi:hypothetical protein